jgi:hypothetical protein
MACCFLLLLTLNGEGLAQPIYAIEGALHRGHMIVHRPLVDGLQSERIKGYEVSLYGRVSGKKQWHHDYKIPFGGIYAGWWNLGNKNTLGYSFSIVPFIDFKLSSGKKTSFNLKFGWGIGINEKKFDAENNYKNVVIGSKINNSILLHPTFSYRFTEKTCVKVGLSLFHLSNGSFENPNLGINLISFTTGLVFGFGNDTVYAPFSQKEGEIKHEAFVYGSMFAKEIAPPDGKRYTTASLVFDHMWKTSRKMSFGGGVDVFYDKSLTQRSNYNEQDGILGIIRSGIHGGTEMRIGSTSIILNMGAYFYSGAGGESIFHRFGIRQKLKQKWALVLHVKSHWGKADHMEIGIGRSLSNRNRLKKDINTN